MSSGNAIHVSAGYSWIAILLDKLRLNLRFRVRLSEKRIFLVFGVVVLMMGANSAFAQVQTCAIITGGDAGQGRGVSPTYLANQDGPANEGCTILLTPNADVSITTPFPNPSPSYDNGLDY